MEKEIKEMLGLILNKLDGLESRMDRLESRQDEIFMVVKAIGDVITTRKAIK